MKIFTVTNALVILLLFANPSYANLSEQDFYVETPIDHFNAGVGLLHLGNFKTATERFRKAAVKGHAKAQAVLGSMYANGLGVRQDLLTAHAWISLALPQLYGFMLHRVEAVQDELELIMSPAQIKKAHALTDSWITMFPPMDR